MDCTVLVLFGVCHADLLPVALLHSAVLHSAGTQTAFISANSFFNKRFIQENLMAKTVADVMKMVKENEVKFVDFRFTDTRGKQQHTTVPVSHFDEDKFTSGHAFDGSSIAGWKGIEASDMQLIPDPSTANIDPFFEETTLILTCDVIEPTDGKAYDRAIPAPLPSALKPT